MDSVAIVGSKLAWPFCENRSVVNIAGRPIPFALVNSKPKSFEPAAPQNQNLVHLRVEAFSCNYRDKGLLLQFDSVCKEKAYLGFGSEFVGRVLEVGAEVKDLKVDDRVVLNGSYPSSGVPGVLPGLPTNHASLRHLLVHEARLMKIPPEMPNEVAAAFSVGAQTTYGMLRRLALKEGDKVLVTAARSNTSLAALAALKLHKVEAYALTTSTEDLPWPELAGLLRSERGQGLSECAELVALAKTLGGFDAVIDPFFDLYVWQVLPFLRSGGKYISCGSYRQMEEYAPDEAERGQLFQVGIAALAGNFQLLGNCLGETSDLQRALRDYTSGELSVVIDSVFSGPQVGEFVERSYNDPARFGKVVYQYA